MMSKRRERRHKSADKPISAQPHYQLRPYDLISTKGVATIHQAALTLLEEVGICLHDEPILAMLQENGAKIEGQTAFLDRRLVEESISQAPAQFTQLARNPQHNVTVGGDRFCFAPTGMASFLRQQGGSYPATLAELALLTEAVHTSPHLHHTGAAMLIPHDRPIATRHLDCLQTQLRHSEKPLMGAGESAEQAADCLQMVELLWGAETMRQNPTLLVQLPIASPRRFDRPMLGALKQYAQARQAILLTSMLLRGATAPHSIAGMATQAHAELLGGLTVIQRLMPGCPVIYGVWQSSLDLHDGHVIARSAENRLLLLLCAQLARHCHLPFHGRNDFITMHPLTEQQHEIENLLQAHAHFIMPTLGSVGESSVDEAQFKADCDQLGRWRGSWQHTTRKSGWKFYRPI